MFQNAIVFLSAKEEAVALVHRPRGENIHKKMESIGLRISPTTHVVCNYFKHVSTVIAFSRFPIPISEQMADSNSRINLRKHVLEGREEQAEWEEREGPRLGMGGEAGRDMIKK